MNMRKVVCAGVCALAVSGAPGTWGSEEQTNEGIPSVQEPVDQADSLKSQFVQTDSPESQRFAFLYDLRLTRLEKRLDELDQRTRESSRSVEQRMDDLSCRIGTVNTNLTKLTKNFEALTKDTQEKDNDLAERIELLRKESEKNSSLFEKLQKKMKEQERQLSSFLSDWNLFNQTFLKCNEQVGVLAEQTNCNTKRWEFLYDDVLKERSRISEQKASLQALEEAVEKLAQGVHKAGTAMTEGFTEQKTKKDD